MTCIYSDLLTSNSHQHLLQKMACRPSLRNVYSLQPLSLSLPFIPILLIPLDIGLKRVTTDRWRALYIKTNSLVIDCFVLLDGKGMRTAIIMTMIYDNEHQHTTLKASMKSVTLRGRISRVSTLITLVNSRIYSLVDWQ